MPCPSHCLYVLRLISKFRAFSSHVHSFILQLVTGSFIHHLPCDSAIPFLGIYPREMKTYVLQKAGIRTFRAALFIIAPNWKQPKCPSTGGWINKPWCIHTIKLILSSKKNEQLIHATTLINIKNIMLSHTLANYGPQAKSSPPSVFITKCSWNTAAPLHV